MDNITLPIDQRILVLWEREFKTFVISSTLAQSGYLKISLTVPQTKRLIADLMHQLEEYKNECE